MTMLKDKQKNWVKILSMSKLNSAKLFVCFMPMVISSIALFLDKMTDANYAMIITGLAAIFCGSRAATDIMSSKNNQPQIPPGVDA